MSPPPVKQPTLGRFCTAVALACAAITSVCTCTSLFKTSITSVGSRGVAVVPTIDVVVVLTGTGGGAVDTVVVIGTEGKEERGCRLTWDVGTKSPAVGDKPEITEVVAAVPLAIAVSGVSIAVTVVHVVLSEGNMKDTLDGRLGIAATPVVPCTAVTLVVLVVGGAILIVVDTTGAEVVGTAAAVRSDETEEPLKAGSVLVTTGKSLRTPVNE